ncbi:MAG: hypothetical protein FWE80_08655 [Oscillospiraceae bacterium]|nr:hypothetical protein [Oscillospiraceae bacterium]
MKIYTPPQREAVTKVLELKTLVEEPLPLPPYLELEEQLVFDDFPIPEENIPEFPEEWEIRLQEARRKKAEKFRLNNRPGVRKSGGTVQPLVGGPEDIFETEPETGRKNREVLDDFNSYSETEMVRKELRYRYRAGAINLFVTGVLTVLLTVVTLVQPNAQTITGDPVLYLLINAVLLTAVMGLQRRTLLEGLKGLFWLRPNTDSGVALIAVVVLFHIFGQIFSSRQDPPTDSYTAAAGFSLFIAAAARKSNINRIWRNFRFASHNSWKYAAHSIANPDIAEKIARAGTFVGRPQIVCFHETEFLSGFMKYSYLNANKNRLMGRYTLTAVIAAMICAGSAWYNELAPIPTDIAGLLSLFICFLLLAVPAFTVMTTALPVSRNAKSALRCGAMMIGQTASEQYKDANGVVIDIAELFPSESVILHGIKTFSGTRIDQAILDAAAVVLQAGGPLTGIFKRVIENKTDILQEVDTLIYEQEMGLSGWVGGRRVLVGNRKLLENHNVDAPSGDFEARYRKGNRKLLYLSVGGELSAMFVISYTADARIRTALQRLNRADITLLVRTVDPNVTQAMLCDIFELDDYYVEVLDVSAGRVYDKLVAKTVPAMPALLAANGRAEGIAASLAAAYRTARATLRITVFQILLGILGLLIAGLVVFYNQSVLLPLEVLGMSAFGAVLSWLNVYTSPT